MFKFVVLVSLVAAACGLPATPVDPVQLTSAYNYHAEVGIKEASRIKAAEEAKDFDGSRVTGGSYADLGDYPHMGGLLINLMTGWTSICGSSLLSHTKLVTAAHCWWDGVNQGRMLTVVLGSLGIFSGGTRRDTTDVVVHQDWVPNWSIHDIAIITVPYVPFSYYVQPIALASGQNNYVNTVGWAAGFGVYNDDSGIEIHQRMTHVQLRVITNTECQGRYGDVIVPSTMCTDGSDLKSTCAGDSGGPLHINRGNEPTLIGITSFRYKWGCQRGWPSVFTRVDWFESWIRSQL